MNPFTHWQLLWKLTRPHRGALICGLLLVTINRASMLVLPFSAKPIMDDVLLKKRSENLWILLIIIAGSLLMQAATSQGVIVSLSRAAHLLISDLRKQVHYHIGYLPVGYFDANTTGSIVSRIMSDVAGVAKVFGTALSELFGAIITILVSAIVLFMVSPGMTLLVVSLFAMCYWPVLRAFNGVNASQRRYAQISGEVSGRLSESISGVRVVKGYRAEGHEALTFARGADRLAQNGIMTLAAVSRLNVMSSILIGVASLTVLVMGAHSVQSRAMTIGDYVRYIAFFSLLSAPLRQLVYLLSQMSEGIASLQRAQDVFEEQREDRDPRRTLTPDSTVGVVELEDVSFAYQDKNIVLRDVSFSAQPGSLTAIVGPTGSGKSTILNLICGFYNPTTGVVRVDGVDLRRIRLDKYRSRLGIVGQEAFLFNGTIWENVSFGRPDASRQDIIDACRIANVDTFAERLECGYNSIVGERGVRLSGGQRQLICIARALVADARILILDEATSSVDSESEALVQESIHRLVKGRTTFVVTHRLDTIREADNILVLERGGIIEEGTHESLFRTGTRYWDLCTKRYSTVG